MCVVGGGSVHVHLVCARVYNVQGESNDGGATKN